MDGWTDDVLVPVTHDAELIGRKDFPMKRTLSVLILLTAAVSTVPAALVTSDPFNYPDGGIVTNSSGTWLPNTGTANSMLVSNQELVVSTSRSEDVARQFPSAFATNGSVNELYSSYTIKCVALPNLAGTYFSHFTGSNVFGTLTGHRARVWASTTNVAGGTVAGPTQFMLGIVNSGNGSTTNGIGQWATPIETNVTYTIVTRYVLATGISTLWVNPTAESDPSVTASDLVPADIGPSGLPTNGVVNIGHYGFRQATGEGTMLIDNFKVATRFNDIAGTNTTPTISSIPQQSSAMSTPVGPIAFTIGDAESGASTLTLSSDSSNPTLVPTNNIVFGGADENRTVTITPASGQQGSATITLSVSDGVNTGSVSFVLTVGAPSISAIPNQITQLNTPTPAIPFTVGDAESSASSLIVSNTTSNPSLIVNVAFGGSGANRTVTVTPQTGQTGVATVAVYVSDGINVTSTNFVLTISPNPGLLLSDAFWYTDFLQDTALYGATGSPWGHASGTNYDLLVIDGSAQLIFQRSEDLGAALTGGPFAVDSGLVIYSGFTIVLTNLPSVTGNYFAHLKDSVAGTTFRGKIYVSTSNAASGHYRVGIANAANSVNAQFPQDLNLNETNSVIYRYNSGTGGSTLWVNPASQNSLSVTASDDTTANAIGAFGLRQDTGIGTIYLDNLIVSSSFNDLTSLLVTNVPVVPIPLQIQASAGAVVLSWTNSAFVLQSAASLTDTFTNVPGATSPHTNIISGQKMFFRLKAN